MIASSAPTDPADIGEADRVKLIALYARLCPEDVVAIDDPRRDVIAAEMLDIGLAPSPEAALQVIAWWDPIADNLRPIVAGVRRSFSRLKLEGRYGAT